MDRRILVVGATGLVGSALMYALQDKGTVMGTHYSQACTHCMHMDMEYPSSIASVLNQFRPNDVYIAAAITNVDRCEVDGTVRKVNVDAVKQIVDLCAASRCRVIFLSSSYVFDGTSKRPYSIYDKPNPVNHYGIQKLLAEKYVLNNGLDSNLIVRTVGVFGQETAKKNFAYQIVSSLVMGRKVFAPQDQLMNPVHADDLAIRIVQLADIGHGGVVHLAGEEGVSKYTFACDVARACGFSDIDVKSMIVPSTGLMLGQSAVRPEFACLMNTLEPRYGYMKSLENFARDY